MTTPTVPTVTDELIAELEAAASDSKLNIYRPFGWAHSVRCGNHMQTDFDFLSLASPETILALLSERADLKQQLAAASVDAERLNSGCIVTSERDEFGESYMCERRGLDLRAMIDAARNIAGDD